MKYILGLFLLVGCSDSPEYMKAQAAKEEQCVEACKPFEFKNYSGFTGCHCEVKK